MTRFARRASEVAATEKEEAKAAAAAAAVAKAKAKATVSVTDTADDLVQAGPGQGLSLGGVAPEDDGREGVKLAV